MTNRHSVKRGSTLWRGVLVEDKVSKKLNDIGIENTLMPLHHPFDIFTKDRVRIDVKSVWKKNGGFYDALLDQDEKEIDFFIVVAMDNPEKPIYFVVPAYGLKPVSHISIRGPNNGKWTWTHERFDLL